MRQTHKDTTTYLGNGVNGGVQVCALVRGHRRGPSRTVSVCSCSGKSCVCDVDLGQNYNRFFFPGSFFSFGHFARHQQFKSYARHSRVRDAPSVSLGMSMSMPTFSSSIRSFVDH